MILVKNRNKDHIKFLQEIINKCKSILLPPAEKLMICALAEIITDIPNTEKTVTIIDIDKDKVLDTLILLKKSKMFDVIEFIDRDDILRILQKGEIADLFNSKDNIVIKENFKNK